MVRAGGLPPGGWWTRPATVAMLPAGATAALQGFGDITIDLGKASA